jgi:cation diffusion facilitator family transporter
MSHPPEPTEREEHMAAREKRAAALSSVLAAVFLTALKLVVGLLTGSLGILAEAAHSGLDLVAALVTFFAVRLSDRPPDEGHLYGHGKVENLSALVETLLLLLTCVWIFSEAIQRLFFETVEVEPSVWAFGIMLASIVVDISRSRMLYAAARKHNSQALEADALHFSTDVWSSAVVIGGLGLVWLSGRLGPEWAWLAQADAAAAMIVALIVVYVSLQLGRRAVAVLLDEAPPGLVERVVAEARQVPGVEGTGAVRVRQAGAAIFVDLTVAVGRSATLEEAHDIATLVEQRIGRLVGRGDVVVHVDPERTHDESLPQTVSAVAAGLGLRAHNVHAHDVRGRYYLDLDVEVPPEWNLARAHEEASRLEEALLGELPDLYQVQTHIEPQAVPVATAAGKAPDAERLRARIRGLVEGVKGLHGCHDVQLRPGPEGYDVVLHCLADAELPIGEAHHLSEQLKRELMAQMEGIHDVLVHVEPEGEEG